MLSSEEVVALALRKWNENTTKAQRFTLLALPMGSGSVSAIGSTLILCMLLKRGDARHRMPDRLLFAMSFVDILVSLSHVFGAFAVPSNTGAPLARGSWATCELAGFVTNMNYTVGIYNVWLLVYALMRIRYKWGESSISRRFEIPMHCLAISFPLATGTVAIIRDAFNPLPAGMRRCYSALYPPRCFNLPNAECERGDPMQHWYLSYGPTGVLIICFLALLLMIYSTALVVYRRGSQWDFVRSNQNGAISRRTANTKAMANQSIFYGLSFFLTYIWGIALPVWATLTAKPTPPYILTCLFELFFPLQGCFVFVNFARPRFLRIHHCRNDKSVLWAMKETVVGLPMNNTRYARRQRRRDDPKSSSSSSGQSMIPSSIVQHDKEFSSSCSSCEGIVLAGGHTYDEQQVPPVKTRSRGDRQDFRTAEFTLRLSITDSRDGVFDGDFDEPVSNLSSLCADADVNAKNYVNGATVSPQSPSSCSDHSTNDVSNDVRGEVAKEENASKRSDDNEEYNYHQDMEYQLPLNDTLTSHSDEEVVLETLQLQRGLLVVEEDGRVVLSTSESGRENEEHVEPTVSVCSFGEDDTTIDA
jgi:hypothetical protein